MIPNFKYGLPGQPMAVTGKFQPLGNKAPNKALCQFATTADSNTLLKSFWEIEEVPKHTTTTNMTGEKK